MKTLLKDGKSVYMLDDADTVTITADMVEVRGTKDFNIGDMNSGNAVLHEGVTPPADWKGGKYAFDGSTWTVVVPDAVPASVTMRQLRLAAIDAGKLGALKTAIAAADDAGQTEWEYSTTVERNSAIIADMMSTLSLTAEQMDDIFKTASTK